MFDSETGALLQLRFVKGLGPKRVSRLLFKTGAAMAAFEQPVSVWAKAMGVSIEKAEAFKAQAQSDAVRQKVTQEFEKAEACGATLVGIHTPGYPPLLTQAADAPPVLWIKGELLAEDLRSLAVVGARKCTGYGREQAGRLSSLAADAGLTIVSGGAYGIDAAAHQGALRAGGRTVVILGSAVDRYYPAEHAALFDEVAEGRGAVISELALGTGPHHSHFLPRNRLIACMSLGTLVVEAALRSGALNTARRAVEEGRPVMYLPGRVDSSASAGCHAMIRAGEGVLVQSIADILETLNDASTLIDAVCEQAGEQLTLNLPDSTAEHPAADSVTLDAPSAALSGDGRVSVNVGDGGLGEAGEAGDGSSGGGGGGGDAAVILRALEQVSTLDELIAATGLSVQVVNTQLTMLEIRGHVKRVGGEFMVVRRR